MRQVDKNSVVVGGHLLGRDEKVKVSAKKNACSNADQNSCENILRRTAMCEVLLQYVAFQQHTSSLNLCMAILVMSERPTDRTLASGFTQ